MFPIEGEEDAPKGRTGRRLHRGPWTRALAALSAMAVFGSAGCATDANIRELAAKSNDDIYVKARAGDASGTRPELECAESQRYVDELADMVLAAARSMRHSIEVDKEGNLLPPEERAKNDWIYDEFEALVLIDPTMNAFVVGDNSVYVHTSLLLDAECPEQVLGILCHEFGHIALRHSKNNIESMRAAGVIQVAGGFLSSFVPLGGLIGAGAGLANNVMAYANNKAEETDADLYGLRLFASMGHDPAHMARFFDVIREKYGDGGALDTHPKNSARSAKILEVARQENLLGPGRAYASLDRARFASVQESVRREQERFIGQPVLADRATRMRAQSCFDYCHDRPK